MYRHIKLWKLESRHPPRTTSSRSVAASWQPRSSGVVGEVFANAEEGSDIRSPHRTTPVVLSACMLPPNPVTDNFDNLKIG